jgi:dTDP-4-dehydrorhamnose reductase
VGDHGKARVLLLGARGQVGRELIGTLAPFANVEALDRAALDLADLDAVASAVRAAKADVVINAAAYTQVERAETEPALARRINGDAPEVLAKEAARSGALLVHFSTDYVFDGTAKRPYREDDPPVPTTAYGSSKLAGDEAVLGSHAEAYVFRVAWVYSRGRHNFLTTMERLARERDELRVVADQYGTPTWSRAIAEATAQAVAQWWESRGGSKPARPRGLYHMASADHTTWHGFASAIVDHLDFPPGKSRPIVTPITSAEYVSRVARPAWTVLDSRKLLETFGLSLPSWKKQLEKCLA